MQHRKRLYWRVLYQFQGLKQWIKEKLYLVFFQSYLISLQFIYIVIQRSIVTVLWDNISFVILIVGLNYTSKSSLCLTESHDILVQLTCAETFYPGKTYIFMYCKVNYLLVVLEIVFVLFEANPVFTSLFWKLLLFLHIVTQTNLWGISATDRNQLLKHLAFRKRKYLLLGHLELAC